ncbi:unnamed protein product [Periconia digitata]|uniref:Alcohol dehydrogenase-like N-terminal domain-containing protein n=1 Tax=Periconia digitata TaxID=1303443 RepID=A0A9W4XPR0_9PLEO|nr:unnamed protein product [Periconia digitata]
MLGEIRQAAFIAPILSTMSLRDHKVSTRSRGSPWLRKCRNVMQLHVRIPFIDISIDWRHSLRTLETSKKSLFFRPLFSKSSFQLFPMPTFTVYKGQKDGIPRKSTTTKPDELTGDKVLMSVSASGICGTDLHFRTEDIVLGHEGVGVVQAIGPEVKHLKIGDRVGWGYETNSCGHCLECIQGFETFCPEREMYSSANLDQGSFATHAIWREAFLHLIPESMSDEAAAPLQCGGATTFTALNGVKPTDTVGIMGVGGLGHIPIQFASKMGCKVIVLSGTDSKKVQALKLGAHEFAATKGKDVNSIAVSHPINRLLVTTSA